MSFHNNRFLYSLVSIACFALAFAFAACHFPSEGETVMDVEVDSTWLAYDSVLVELRDNEGNLIATLFHGPIESEDDLKKLPAKDYEGNTVHVVVTGYIDGEAVKIEDRKFNGEKGVNDTVVLVKDPDVTDPIDTTVTNPIDTTASDEARLLSLSISACDLVPAFSPSVKSYACKAPLGVGTTTVKAKGNGSLKLNTSALEPDKNSVSIPLSLGVTMLIVEVTAENETKATYEVGVVRLDASQNNALIGLQVSKGTLQPGFSPDNLKYTVAVKASDKELGVKATVAEPTASLSLNGNNVNSGSFESVTLDVNETEIPIALAVKAENGKSRNYEIKVIRLSDDAALSSLEFTSGDAKPDFNPDSLKYRVTVGEAVSSIKVKAVARDSGATLRLDGESITSGVSSAAIDLAMGLNESEIEVTAADGETKLTYSLAITRIDDVPPAKPVVTAPASPFRNVRPVWKWTSGGGGNGNFRYKLNDTLLSSGAIESNAVEFAPTSDLADGLHTLYVQERDSAGNWSATGSAGVTIVMGPITWFKFDGDGKNEGVNSNSVTLSGATFTTDRLGAASKALNFDGVNDSARTSGRTTFDTGKNLTVSLWVKLPASPTGLRYFMRAPEGGIGIFMNGASVGMAISVPGTSSAKAAITTTNWVHFAGTYDGFTIRAYLNGVLQESTSHTGTITGDISQITFGYFAGNFWQGALDEVRFYDRTLNATEVLGIYNSTKPPVIIIKDPPILIPLEPVFSP